MSMRDDKKLLREFVRELLNEDDTGGGYDMGGGMGSGWGYYDYGKPLSDIFIKPFLDVGTTAMAVGTKFAARSKTLVKTLIETALTTAIPFLQSNYALIFSQEKQELEKIKEKYKAVFEANNAAFTEDVMILSFMLSPSTFLTAKTAQYAPDAIMSTLEVFSHGSENIAAYFEDIRKRIGAIEQDLKMNPDDYKVRGDKVVGANSRGPYMTKAKRDLVKKAGLQDALEFDDDVIFEAMPVQQVQQPQQQAPAAQTPEQKKTAILMQVASDPNLKKMIASSPLARQMETDARQIASNISSKIMKEASGVLNVKTAQDLQRVINKPIGLEKLNAMQPQEKQQAEQTLLTQTKAAMKSFYVKTIQTEINNLTAKGVDANNLYITTLKNTMAKVSKFN